MKKFIFIVLLLSCIQLIKAQFPKEDIIGRWIEAERILNDSTTIVVEDGNTYIFRENMIFHKGESSEGVIFFNIAGVYDIEDNRIKITYKDYAYHNSNKQNFKLMEMKIINITEDEMLVSTQDYNYEYSMLLKKLN